MFGWAVTALVAAANVRVYVAELCSPDPDAFIDAFAYVPYDLTAGIVLPPPSPPWPPLTVLSALFVHASVLHLAFNLLFFVAVGQVKGFAFFLGLSTLMDIFMTYFFTRPFVILLGRSRSATEAKGMGVAKGLGIASGVDA